MKARDLFEWNGELPNVFTRDITPEGHATPIFAVIADYGWAERILCGDCYQQDAEAIALAIQEALS